jgi:NADH dehydrogenase FAD-containing subunit
LTSEALKAKLTPYGQNPFRLVMVGGGATGVEAATQVKGSYPHSQVSLVTQGAVGAFKGTRVQRQISRL